MGKEFLAVKQQLHVEIRSFFAVEQKASAPQPGCLGFLTEGPRSGNGSAAPAPPAPGQGGSRGRLCRITGTARPTCSCCFSCAGLITRTKSWCVSRQASKSGLGDTLAVLAAWDGGDFRASPDCPSVHPGGLLGTAPVLFLGHI